jgi:hypothetical protein
MLGKLSIHFLVKQKAGQKYDIKIGDESSKSVAKFRYLGHPEHLRTEVMKKLRAK